MQRRHSHRDAPYGAQFVAREHFLASQLASGNNVNEHLNRQLQLLLAMLRSVRRTERCRHDIHLLMGTHGPYISPEWTATIEPEGVQIWRVPPLFPGIPSADKLHVWKLGKYSKVLVVDSDVLVLRSLDDAFAMGSGDEFSIAHHPYEMQQAQCGIPVHQRGVGGLFVARPNESTFSELVAYIATYPTHHLQHYSEQTALSCFFRNRTRVLPCSFLFDLSSPAMSSCTPGASSTTCLRKHMQNCIKFGPTNMRRSCLSQPPESCDKWADREACLAVSQHVRTCGSWPVHSRDVRAVHFKGRIKPWPTGNSQRNNNWMCRPMRSGALRLMNGSSLVKAKLYDTFRWEAELLLPGTQRRGACISTLSGVPVHWAKRSQGPMVARKCCHAETLMSAEWHEILHSRLR